VREPRGRSRSQGYSQIALLHSHLFLHDQLTFADISGTDIGLAQLPDGATLQRPDEMRQQMVRQASSVPGVSHTVEFTGFSGLDGTNRSNAVTTFLVLAPFEERIGTLALLDLVLAEEAAAEPSARELALR